MHGRMLQLDILRGFAILFVILYHWPHDTAVPALVAPFRKAGWSGVDLFFVLSGSLVSGLLFKEYKAKGGVRIGRFLARRGFKIYPAFYVLIAFTVAALSLAGSVVPNQKALSSRGIIGELVFLQNYVGNLWGHTWSLAIEEHFYLTLSVCVLLLTRRSGGSADPFRCVVPAYFAIATVCLLGRIAGLLAGPVRQPMQATHLRMDALAFGVLLSYLYHFRSEELARVVAARKLPILVAGIAMLMPSWLGGYYHPVNLSLGLALLPVGYGSVLLVLVHTDLTNVKRTWLGPPLAAISLIGFYSYSIYLWHWPILSTAPKLFVRLLGAAPTLLHTVLIMLATLVFGIAMAALVERPFLRLRDRVLS